MPLLVNLRHLDAHNLDLEGQLTPEELDVDTRDEMIKITQPLDYDIEVQKVEDGILAQGSLSVPLSCQCVRCLKPFDYVLNLPNWSELLPLTGEDAVPVVNDCVDLTPLIREDILLEFPQHPLCDPECQGLPQQSVGKGTSANDPHETSSGSSAWSELNKLKF